MLNIHSSLQNNISVPLTCQRMEAKGKINLRKLFWSLQLISNFNLFQSAPHLAKYAFTLNYKLDNAVSPSALSIVVKGKIELFLKQKYTNNKTYNMHTVQVNMFFFPLGLQGGICKVYKYPLRDKFFATRQ